MVCLLRERWLTRKTLKQQAEFHATQSMIPKSGHRFSEKIMLHE
jgi:hypothetical protein